MPSPFPGMDPFLEKPNRWEGAHSRLINAISDNLAELVAPNFYVDIEAHVYIVTPEDEQQFSMVPDVYVVAQPTSGPQTALATIIAPPTLIEPLFDPEIRDRYIEIRDAEYHKVVTTIELLSPFNKAANTRGREAFLRKQKAVMASDAHWIEIDLLRTGERSEDLAGKSDYYALLKRARPSPFEVWFFDLRDRMPTIAVPLRPPFEDVPLDLQAVFDTAYTRAHYADSVDYTAAVPPPRLRPADAAWAAARVGKWLSARHGAVAGPEPKSD
jgi:Protein of unknown function (DUF4058)